MERRRQAIGSRTLSAIFLALFTLGAASSLGALERKTYTIHIVVDVLKPKFQEVVDGIKATLDRELAAAGASATYTVHDTRTDPKTVPAILAALEAAKPDLVFAVNNPATFADSNISLKLDPARFRVVSENCIPLQSGVAKSFERPGGHITGVGVFVRMNSVLRLAKMIRPESKKLVFFSWSAMGKINEWFLAELTRACAEEGIELAQVKYLSSAEEQFAFYLECDKLGPEYFGFGAVSVWVKKDGSYAPMDVIEKEFVRDNIRHFPQYCYDEVGVMNGAPAGACVIWRDLGEQMGEKGLKILNGAKPGELPWEYPRKYNLLVNLAGAKSIGLGLPDNLIRAAYRVYTDLDGRYIGRGN
ncbi:MAG: hypothetical protein JNG85_04685 [Spirochaetaceae bacterium]|nr:hypothetical protein [Spirochaetaceae bacterium]